MQREPIITQLAEGTPILLRPIAPDDKPLLMAAMARLSEQSRRLRFLVPTDHLSRSQLAYLTEVDQIDHQAWGVLAGEEPVAVGRLVRIGDDEAEVAITVVDDWQRKGIGEILLRLLGMLAREAGISRLVLISLPENQGIARLTARLPAERRNEEGLVVTTIEVAGIPLPEWLGHSGGSAGDRHPLGQSI